jgi:hypothetical protein
MYFVFVASEIKWTIKLWFIARTNTIEIFSLGNACKERGKEHGP